jgi:hypothetical protein
LAELSYVGGEPVITTTGPRSRALSRPRIGYGATPAQGTPWEPWVVAVPTLRGAVGLQVRIDTSAAGFTELPCYFAWLQWPRVAESHLPYPVYLSLAFQYVEEPAIDRFVFRVALPLGFLTSRSTAGSVASSGRRIRGEDEILGIARGQQLAVCWLGIQHERGPNEPGGSHQEGL